MQTQFELTRAGFVLLAMGFTSAATMEWKVRFIEAFNMMEAEPSPKLAAEADGMVTNLTPARFADGLAAMEKVALVREARLAHGRTAAQHMWEMVDLPNVTG